MLAFWHEVHGPSGLAEGRLIIVRDCDDVIGIGPFFAGDQRRLGLREWWPLGVGIGQRTGPLARPGREQEVADAIACLLVAERATALRLPAVDSSTPWAAWLTRAWPARARPEQVVEAVVPSPQITIRPDGDHDAWFAQRSRNFRSDVVRRGRLAEKRGGHIRRIDDPSAAPAALASLFALHRERLTALGRRTSMSREVERAVVAGTIALMTSGQRARIWVVEAADQIVAADLSFVAGSRMCSYNAGVDPGWAKESLGTLLLEAAVRDAHALGARVLDLGAGDQFYKTRFADGDAPLAWASLVPRGARYPLERARLAPEQVRRATRRAAKRLPESYQHRLRASRRILEHRRHGSEERGAG
jgi:CelD/BcsL family acetyltransferase involved in cellulose biosynthesis